MEPVKVEVVPIQRTGERTIPKAEIIPWTGELPTTEQQETRRDINAIDETLNRLEKGQTWLAGAIPPLGAAAGTAIGGPLGSVPGYMLGSLAKQALQTQFPAALGTAPDTGEGALTDIGLDLTQNLPFDLLFTPAAKYGARAITKTGEPLKTALAKKFVNKSLDPEIASFLQQNPQIPITVGQGGGNWVANLFENILTPDLKRKVRDTQQKEMIIKLGDLMQQYSPTGSPIVPDAEVIGHIVKTELEAGEKQVSQTVTGLKNNLLTTAGMNKVTEPIIKEGKKVGEREVLGPTYFQEAALYAQDFINRLKARYGVGGGKSLYRTFRSDPEMSASLKALEDIANTLDPKTGEIKPIALETALDIKALTGNKGFVKKVGAGEYVFMKLNRAIDRDIQKSLGDLPNGSTALDFYKQYNAAATFKAQMFKETAPIANTIESTLSGMPNVKQILADPVAIEKTITASRNPSTTRKALQTEFLTDIFLSSRSFDKESGQFVAKVPYAEFTNRANTPIAKILFPPSERQGINNFLKTIQHLDPKLPLAGVTALGIRATGAGLTFASGAIGSAFTGSLSTGAQLGGLISGVLVGSRDFTKRVLLNDRNARLAARLAHLPPESGEAKAITKVLFSALKGTQVALLNQEGVELGPARIDNNGKVVAVEVGK